MNGLIMALQLILGLSVIVFIHELGHYLAARMFGIRVDKFYLFFDAWGIKLLSFKIGDTEYGIGWLPLGGYCKISGMIDESLDKEQMSKPPQSWEYRSKPAWQRFIVVVGGVVFNLVLGIAIFAALLFSQTKAYLPVAEVNKTGIYASQLAQEVGLRNGDKIVAVNGSQLTRFEDLQSLSLMMGGEITVLRDGSEITVAIPDTLYKQFQKSIPAIRFIDALNYPVIVDTFATNMGASVAGFIRGDSIMGIDSCNLGTLGKMRETLALHKDDSVVIHWQRAASASAAASSEDSSAALSTALQQETSMNAKVYVDSFGYIGIVSLSPYSLEKYGFWTSIKYGTKDAFDLIIANARGLGKIFSGKEKASESLQGPIGIATIYGSEWNWLRFWRITGMLSLILAFMNILPVPGLDGGHVMFTLTEIITRRKPSDKFLENAQKIGMVILLALMVFVIGNDLFKLFFK